MSDHDNVVIWVDHRQAMVFQFDAAGFDRATVRSAHPDRHVLHTARPGQSTYPPLDKSFFMRVMQTIEQAASILITGPTTSKTELAQYIEITKPALAARICGIETLDHPTNSALISLARTFFKSDSQMHSQSRR